MIAGVSHFPNDLDAAYSRIHAGVAWPGLRAGWVVIAGEHRTQFVGDGPRLDVLDEARDERLWHVVERAAALWFYYRPEVVAGDRRHVAALQFVHQRQQDRAYRDFEVAASPVAALDASCAYALPLLARLLESGRLVLPEASGLRGEVLVPSRREDPAKLLLADYPAVAALAYAVLGLELTRPDPREAETDPSLRRLYG